MSHNMLQNICRTCLATCGELVPIFSNDYYVHNLSDKLFHTTRIEVSQDDNLPKMMCKKCIFLVDSLYCFKDQCEMAEIKLKKSLNDSDFNLSDTISSSEEEYHIEYASEEARREVENARKKTRNAKKKFSKNSGVKIKSVEILSKECKDNIYKNFSGTYKYNNPEIDNDTYMSDSDKSSLYVSESSKKKKINFFKDLNLAKTPSKSTPSKPGSKRKHESDASFNKLSKVPKKVVFKDNDYSDENMEFIEVSDNQTDLPNKEDDDSHVIQNDLDSGMQDNEIDDGTEKFLYNFDFSINEDHDTSRTSNSLATFELPTTSSENDKKIYDIYQIRMDNLIKHVVLNIPKVCVICSEFFDTYTDVLKHKLETHLNTDEDYIFCPVCHEKFFSNSNLVEHMNEHTNIHSFMCILCLGNFHTLESLRTHLHSHVDVREIKCQICSKKFQKMQTLLSHLEQHITNKQICCPLCNKKFNSKDLLQIHIDNDHKKTPDETSDKCQTCGVAVSEEDKEEHEKSHNPYACPYCERSFNKKTILRDHVFTHLGVQNYACLVCEKTFASQEERTQHMQVHMKPQQKNDKKKFRCRVCHEILVSRVAYGQHLKEKHWNSKQTSEILKELSDSSVSDKVNEHLNKNCATPPATESSNVT